MSRNDDMFMDEEFSVESAEDFFNDLDEEERDFAFENMIPCENCGEMRLKTDRSIRQTGFCYLCAQSEAKFNHRENSNQAAENTRTLSEIVAKWNTY